MHLTRVSLAAAFAVAALASAAHAETVTGTFTFLDGDGSTKPIANATVEVWRAIPRPWPLGPFMQLDATVLTSPSGAINVTLPFAGTNVGVQVRVFATNLAARPTPTTFPSCAIRSSASPARSARHFGRSR